jgi:hypothetical protein
MWCYLAGAQQLQASQGGETDGLEEIRIITVSLRKYSRIPKPKPKPKAYPPKYSSLTGILNTVYPRVEPA